MGSFLFQHLLHWMEAVYWVVASPSSTAQFDDPHYLAGFLQTFFELLHWKAQVWVFSLI